MFKHPPRNEKFFLPNWLTFSVTSAAEESADAAKLEPVRLLSALAAELSPFELIWPLTAALIGPEVTAARRPRPLAELATPAPAEMIED